MCRFLRRYQSTTMASRFAILPLLEPAAAAADAAPAAIVFANAGVFAAFLRSQVQTES